MTTDEYGRFIFITFEDLKKIKFNQLELVCDRVFVFVHRSEESIPFVLVQGLQKLGDSVQWIAVGESTEALHLSFNLGQLHERAEEDVEFAIISEDTRYDDLIEHLNELGRNAVRVTRNAEVGQPSGDPIVLSGSKEETVGTDQEKDAEASSMVDREEETSDAMHSPRAAVATSNQQLCERIARETIKRLVMSGNRPAAIDALKSYILLQYNNAEVNRNIDLIIRKLEKSNDIVVTEKEVVYNF